MHTVQCSANAVSPSKEVVAMETHQKLHNSWGDVKAKIRKAWPRLTEDALEEVNTDFKKLATKIEHAYGYTSEQAIKEFEDFKAKHFPKSA
jgi:uncharacterized protein YjbJ (UPF0337 family)